jgi:hypothetical protein
MSLTSRLVGARTAGAPLNALIHGEAQCCHCQTQGSLPAHADERTRTSTELPPHGPEPNRGPVDASAGVRYVQIAGLSRRI